MLPSFLQGRAGNSVCVCVREREREMTGKKDVRDSKMAVGSCDGWRYSLGCCYGLVCLGCVGFAAVWPVWC